MLKLFKHNSTRINLQKYQQAKTFFIIKKETWGNYISKLNNEPPIDKTWEIIGKTSGRKLQTSITYLNTLNGGKTTDKKEIAYQIAAEFSQNSSSNHYFLKFQKYKNIAEKEKLNFTLKNKENYNSSFTITELKNSINKGKKTLLLVEMKFPIGSWNTCQKHPSQFFCKYSMTYGGQTISLNTGLKLLSSQSPNQEKINLTQQSSHCLNKLHL